MRNPDGTFSFDELSIDDFERRLHEELARVERTGTPTVLTSDGERRFVVQDVEGYRRLLARLEEAEAVIAIQRGLDAARRGELIPLDEAFRQIRDRAPRRRTA